MINELQRGIFSEDLRKEEAGQADRRREPRTRTPRPVYVQAADLSDGHFEEVRTMSDFSRSGFYFTTQRETYREGMHLYVIPALGCLNFEYLAEVVRIDRLPFGEYGVAVHLLRIGNMLVNASSVTKSAFQSFALVDHIPPNILQQDSNG